MKLKLFSLFAALCCVISLSADIPMLHKKDLNPRMLPTMLRKAPAQQAPAMAPSAVCHVTGETYSGTCGDNLSWSLNTSTGVLTITGSGAMYDFAEYDSSGEWTGYTTPWLNYTSIITAVVLPSTLNTIGADAFDGCVSLTSVIIPSSVTSIGDCAFRNCTSLTSITIPNSVTSLGEGVFINNKSLTSVTIPNGITRIEDVFYGCSSLTSITIPSSVTTIGNSAFACCSALTSVTIPSSVTLIDDYAFKSCESLTSITIPNSVTSIGYQAFFGCRGLTSVTIPNSVTSIGEEAFSMCFSLASVRIPNVLPTIGYQAFEGTAITSIYYDGSLTEWCNGNFLALLIYWSGGDLYIQNQKLTTLSFPNSVTSIGVGAFFGCIGLTSITIPNSVTSIGNGAFYGCTALTSITIPNSVTSIGALAFDGCSALTSVTIPENVDTIGNSAFAGCSSLTSIEWNAKQCDIGELGYKRIFYFNSSDDIRKNITSLTIGAQVRSLPDSLCAGMTNLKTITSYAETSPLLGQGVFKNAYSTPKVYVPCNMKPTYQADWTQFAASCYQYVPNNYLLSLRANDYAGGTVTKVSTGNTCEGHVFQATANTGYHFVQWSDGVADNPRTAVLTQDTTFTAVFARSTYTVTTDVNSSSRGTATGGATVYYEGQVVLTATPNYGYRFSYWYGTDGQYFYANPCTLTVRTSDTYTAYFDYETYYLTYYYNSTMGTVTGPSSAEYLDNVTVKAVPNYGYYFTGWSDGVTNATRYVTVRQDTTFRAYFAISRSGSCGTYNNLTWTYDPSTKTLTINGYGALGSNFTYGVEAPNEMEHLVIGNNVTSIGDNAFQNMTSIKTVVIGGNVASIGDNAFAGCRYIEEVTTYATQVPVISSSTFANIGNKSYIYLYVPADKERNYGRDLYWGEFDIQVKGAETVTASKSDVRVVPAENTAEMTWPSVTNASSYELEITKDGVVFCILKFDAYGRLTGIAFAPSVRNNEPQEQVSGFCFTVTGLNSSTQYGYSVEAKNASDVVIDTKTGSFTTLGGTGIEEITNHKSQFTNQKILHDGQIYILHDGKVFDLTGRKL